MRGVRRVSGFPRHCEELTGRANARPMTGSATKQSTLTFSLADPWIASLALAMTVKGPETSCSAERFLDAQPLRSRRIGGTFGREARYRKAAKDDIREMRMAATRIDCDIHPAIGGTRTT